MDLEILKHYLSFLTQTQYDLCHNRKELQLDHQNSFHFFKLLAPKSQPAVDCQMMKNFISSFTYSFQTPQLQDLIKDVKFQLMPEDQKQTRDELLTKGVELFMRRYSRQGAMSFEQFSLFLKEQEELPVRPKELGFPLKRKFFQLLETEIQNLLDAEAFRKAVGLHYRNLDDLFQLISCDEVVDRKQISNLFLAAGQRKEELFMEMLSLRFPLPMNQQTFRRWFAVPPSQNSYKQQTKVYYSSLRRNKPQFSKEDDRFMTPNPKAAAAAAVGLTSTKMTKGERLNSIKRSAIEVSRFISEECPEESTGAIVADILAQEERVNEMKRQLLYQPDYDLELIYQKRGRQFQNILNRKYGSCNFTSFVRYFVPQDFEHRYSAFIKYNKENRLSEETNDLLSQILDQELDKEDRISEWWRPHDREMIFRSYCPPGHKGITHNELSKYFTQRQCKILLDRFDPNKTGIVSFDSFL